MKKITIVSLCSFAFLVLCSITAKVTEELFESYPAPLVIGVAVLLLSGILALIVRDNTAINLLCFFVSAVAMGFLIRAWYLLRGLENSLSAMVLISLFCVVYLWIYFALIRIPFIRRHAAACVTVSLLYFILSAALYIFLVATTKTTFISTMGYYVFLEASFIFAMSLEARGKEELIRNLTLSSYSVFVVAVIVIVFAVMAALGADDCDCDCCDGCCDCLDCSGDFVAESSSAKKRKRNKP